MSHAVLAYVSLSITSVLAAVYHLEYHFACYDWHLLPYSYQISPHLSAANGTDTFFI